MIFSFSFLSLTFRALFFPPHSLLFFFYYFTFQLSQSGLLRLSFPLHHHRIFLIFLTFSILNHLILLPLPFFSLITCPLLPLSIGAFFFSFVPSSSPPLLPLSSCHVCHHVFSLLASFLSSSSRPLSVPSAFLLQWIAIVLSLTSLPSPLPFFPSVSLSFSLFTSPLPHCPLLLYLFLPFPSPTLSFIYLSPTSLAFPSLPFPVVSVPYPFTFLILTYFTALSSPLLPVPYVLLSLFSTVAFPQIFKPPLHHCFPFNGFCYHLLPLSFSFSIPLL